MERADWKRLIEEQRSSGKSISLFCREHGLKDNAFHYWKDKLGLGDKKFVQVSGREPIEVFLSDGVMLRVSSLQIGLVIKALREA